MPDGSVTASLSDRACFFVGVTGYMDLSPDEIPGMKSKLQRLFAFLRHGANRTSLNQIVSDLIPDSVPPPTRKSLQRSYCQALARWTGLGLETPIVVLSNLAPGVDTILADMVAPGEGGKNAFDDPSIHLLCPLPFPPDIYLRASTFVRRKDGVADVGNSDRQRGFLQLLAKLGAVDPTLIDRVNGTAELDPQIQAALQNVDPEKFFPVPLHNDSPLVPDELIEQYRNDLHDSVARNRRYYAAGEFLAVASHLLIAVWNGEDDLSESGTSAVVKARLLGPKPRVLSSTNDVPLPHGGPIWHLFANRPKKTSNTPAPETSPVSPQSALPLVRILHPHSNLSAEIATGEAVLSSQASLLAEERQRIVLAPSQFSDAELQRKKLSELARSGESIRNFNEQKLPLDLDASLVGQRVISAELNTVIKEASPQLHAKLTRMAQVRARASLLSSCYQGQISKVLDRLFLLTFLAAIGLHIFTHWHVSHHTAAETTHSSHAVEANSVEVEAVEGKSVEAESAAKTTGTELNGVQVTAGWTALTLTMIAIVFFGWSRSNKFEAHGHDARAIAEGIRVQFYWSLAGLGQSVSANYMSRHRSELDWIRGVVRASSMPYDLWSRWFDELQPGLKLQVLKQVKEMWVGGQRDYFKKALHREHHELHLWHKLGGVLALAGVLTILKLAGKASGHILANGVETVCHFWIAFGLLALTFSLAWFLAWRDPARPARTRSLVRLFQNFLKAVAKIHKEALESWNKVLPGRLVGLRRRGIWIGTWLTNAHRMAMELIDILVPTSDRSATSESSFGRRFVRGNWTFAMHLPLALMIACAATEMAHGLHGIEMWHQSLPSPLTLSMIAGGVLLLAGALAVARAEKKLHSELAYQYSTMADLFEAAEAMLNRSLVAFQKATDESDSVRQAELLVSIHSLLFELGREALDENAEWLLLHRARPLEPVMAG